MPSQTVELIKSLREAKDQLTELRKQSDDLDERKRITQEKKDINAEINRLKKAHIDEASLTYKKATRAVIDANASLRKSLAKLSQINTALNAVDKALGLIGAVAPV